MKRLQEASAGETAAQPLRLSCLSLAAVAITAILHGAEPLRPGDVILVNEEEIASERSEVRFVCPAGSVITAIGARAHADNITTMWIDHRPLRPDGTLGPPTAEKLGAEPEHACEAFIRLPESYVACGFGARGAPEWDVTTLWVWARPLLEGGGLGEVRIFKDGFLPEHGLEREAVETRPGRVLTGAGLRFASNDVAGIWARSAEIFVFDGEAIAPRAIFFERPSLEAVPAAESFLRVFPSAEVWLAPGGDGRLERELRRGTVRRVRRTERAFLLADGTEIPAVSGEEVAAGRSDAALAGKQMVISLGEEIDPSGRLPLLAAQKTAYQLLLARKHGLPPVLSLVTGKSLASDESPTTAGLFLMSDILGEKALSPRDSIRSWLKRYGAAAEACGPILERSESLLRRTISLPGGMLWRAGRFLLEPSDASTWWPPETPPSEGLVRGVEEAMQLVLAEIEIAVKSLTTTMETMEYTRERARVHDLRERLAALAELGRFTSAAASGHALAALYRIDGAPATEARLTARIEELRGLAPRCDWGALDPLARHLESLRARARAESPVLLALSSVDERIRRREGEEAANQLRNLLVDEDLLRHLEKHGDRLAGLISSLPGIWDGDPQRDVSIRWGGDGRFELVESHGEWGLLMTDRGPVVYVDWTAPDMTAPREVVVSFSYLDVDETRIVVHYNSDYPGGLEDREYHPSAPVMTRGTGRWLDAELVLDRALFQGKQNQLADLRFIGSPRGAAVRDIRVRMR
ncbi:MAG: hypothetical protein JXA90_00805 [Planctomycetes bacterium]|nr:hypothetical protein [Planctomycetota bacterium]